MAGGQRAALLAEVGPYRRSRILPQKSDLTAQVGSYRKGL